MRLQLATLLILFTASTVWSAPSPAAPAAQGTSVDLNKGVGSNPVGVEPQGGRFAQVIDPKAKRLDGSYIFSTYSKDQAKSVLAIFATNKSRIPFEKPAARVELSGLRRGESEHRIQVNMSVTSNRTLSVSALDLKNGNKPLTVTQIPVNEAKLVKLKAPARRQDGKLDEVAAGPNGRVGSGLKQFVGLRGAGGMFNPLLELGAQETPTKYIYLSTRYPEQLSADVQLFAGDSPFIENTKPYARYLVSGLTPNVPLRNRIKLGLQIDSNGRAVPVATETKTGAVLHVEKFTNDAVERLHEKKPAHPEESIAGRIPASP